MIAMPKANPPSQPARFIASNRPISKPRSPVPDRSAITARLEARIAPLDTPKKKFNPPRAIGERVRATSPKSTAAPEIPPKRTGNRPTRSVTTPESSTVENSPIGAIAATRPTVP